MERHEHFVRHPRGTGGASALYAKPFWQVGITPNDGARDVPDIAFSASVESLPYVVVAGGQTAGYGGTSCAAPPFAGVLALLNQAIGAAKPGLGNVGPMLYALARNPATAGAFHDVTAGSNVVPCQPATPDCPASAPYQFGYVASAGYDQVTGNGFDQRLGAGERVERAQPDRNPARREPERRVRGGDPHAVGRGLFQRHQRADDRRGDLLLRRAVQPGRSAHGRPLGAVPVTPTSSGGAQAATAQLVTFAPPGFTGTSTLVAFYSGHPGYLASWSPGGTVQVSSTFAVVPPSSTVAPAATVAFTFGAGQAP